MAVLVSECTSISSMREFLQNETTCNVSGTAKDKEDCDQELKSIFHEIHQLGGTPSVEEYGDTEDVEMLLNKARELAKEAHKSSSHTPTHTHSSEVQSKIPQIKISKPRHEEHLQVQEIAEKHKDNNASVQNVKEVRRKNVRPLSASLADSKRKEAVKFSKFSGNGSPKKSLLMKQEQLTEELKNANELIKVAEIKNAKLIENNKIIRCKLNELMEQKHILELKLVECEKFIGRLGKEYENKKNELGICKDNEKTMLEEVKRERNEVKNLNAQRERDKVTIQDLQRQCKEMELILRRKHPDSVSALIVASKSSTIDDNKRKLLEERILRLESEISDKENNFQTILTTLQEKFSDMKHKYEAHIIDVERQLMEDRKINAELKNRINRVHMLDVSIQVDSKMLIQNASTQTFLKSTEKLSSAVSRLSQNSSIIFSKLREDSYLIATIKGLQAEVNSKQKIISKVNREVEELRKSLRNMHKEKEVLHNLQPNKRLSIKQAKSTETLLGRIHAEMEAELTDLRRQRETLAMERDGMMQSLKRTNEEFVVLKKKRIQDLHTLQLSHEKELMQLNSQLFPLREEIQLLKRTVELMQSKSQLSDDQMHIKRSNLTRHAQAPGLRNDMAAEALA